MATMLMIQNFDENFYNSAYILANICNKFLCCKMLCKANESGIIDVLTQLDWIVTPYPQKPQFCKNYALGPAKTSFLDFRGKAETQQSVPDYFVGQGSYLMLRMGKVMTLCPAVVNPCPAKAVKWPAFSKTCLSAPIFVVQIDDKFIIGRVSDP